MRSKFARLNSYAGKTMGALLLSTLFTVVAGTTVTFAAPKDVKVFTHSKAGMQALYVAAGNKGSGGEAFYPRSETWANWPLRADGCGVSTPKYKSMILLPGGPSSPPGNSYGDVFGASGRCGGAKDRLWLEGGTNRVAPWAGLPGAWLSPDWRGGWAKPKPATPAMNKAYKINSKNSPCTYPSEAAKVVNSMGAGGGLPAMRSVVEPVWARQCADRTNWLRSLFKRNYTNSQINSMIAQTGGANADQLRSYGTTLLRSEFNISEVDLVRIERAEQKNIGLPNREYGLFIDIVADDFYMAYVNGRPVAGTTQTVDRKKRFVSIAAADLKEGTNLLAVQATDKLMKISVAQLDISVGAGVAYQLVLYDDPVVIEAKFRPSVMLNPSSNVSTGAKFKATFNIENSGPVSGRVGYTTRLFNDKNGNKKYDAADGELVSSSVYAERTIARNDNFQPGAMNGTASFGQFSSGNICAGLFLTEKAGQGRVEKPFDVQCTKIVKQPLVQITGGDVMVGRGLFGAPLVTTPEEVNTLSFQGNSPPARYGSWAEYGIFAAGNIKSYSGGALARSASGGRNIGIADDSLSFANTNPISPGSFDNTGTAPNVLDQYLDGWGANDETITDLNFVLDDVPTGRSVYTYLGSGTLRVTGTVASGTSVVINAPNAAINVGSNINYENGSYTKLSQLPQLIISGSSMYFASNVTNVDGWLLASGIGISTCGPSRTAPDAYYKGLSTRSVCNDNSVTINGPIQSTHLQLRRTTGAEGSSPGELARTAESINLRADAYLWAYGQAARSGGGTQISTQYIQELPPRF